MGRYLIALAVTVSSCATVAAASPGRWGQGKDGVGFAAELLFATDAEVLLRKAEDRELTVLPRKELSDAEERSVALFLQQESTKGSPAEWRTWSNKSGSKQVVGKLVHAEPEHIVLLKKADGLLYVVPFDALCDQDQQYVGNRLKAPVPAEGPMPPAPQEPVPVKPAEKPAPRPEEKEPVPPSTPERKSPSTVEQGRTAKTVPTTTAQNQQVPDSDAVTVEVDKLAWLQTPKVPVEEVSKALNSLWVLPVGEAAGQVEEYRKAIEGASDEGRKAALLLVAVGLERTEQKRAARIAYEEVKAKTGGTPYARSAALRLRLLDLETERLDTEYEKIAGEAAAEEQGWFLIESGLAVVHTAPGLPASTGETTCQLLVCPLPRLPENALSLATVVCLPVHPRGSDDRRQDRRLADQFQGRPVRGPAQGVGSPDSTHSAQQSRRSGSSYGRTSAALSAVRCQANGRMPGGAS